MSAWIERGDKQRLQAFSEEARAEYRGLEGLIQRGLDSIRADEKQRMVEGLLAEEDARKRWQMLRAVIDEPKQLEWEQGFVRPRIGNLFMDWREMRLSAADEETSEEEQLRLVATGDDPILVELAHHSRYASVQEAILRFSQRLSGPKQWSIEYALDQNPHAAHQIISEVQIAAGLEEAGLRYVGRPEVQKALEAAAGRLRLNAEMARQLSGIQSAFGGLLLTRNATGGAVRSGRFIMDRDLSNAELESAALVIKPGSTPGDVLQALADLKARAGDLVVFEEGENLPRDPTWIRGLMRERLGSAASLPRVVVGNRGQVGAMRAVAFELLVDGEGIPDVVFLGAAVTFKDRFDQRYSLVVWTQV